MRQVVDVHVAAFPGFFLTSLGRPFLMVMYRAFLSNPASVFVVDETEGSVLGFAVGSLQTAGGDRSLAIRFLPRFVLALIPGVLRHPLIVTKKIVSQLFTSRGQPDAPEHSAVLRSIGVSPDKRGGGLANELLREFETHARAKGALFVALTTDKADNERAIRFYTKNGYGVHAEFSQDGSRAMLLMKKDIRVA
ncbi:GNAT family N-acetyltransferase [Paraburkholderia sp. D15]|uniref:GNAT family N-acetyltransferase n=1 Tax=Paraburkholderia sp. D15 TaxID=2880218 RepID=UPI00247A46B7|nr:GNAT family N-acetyltransferase [Paraburkholderia sp. D15]WGS50623.1 GNAT family N-acetyltransferase [Paraburkholderia sp. D15]